MDGSGTVTDPYYLDVGAVTYMKVCASEWLGRVMTGTSPSDVDAFVSSMASEILNLGSGSYFQFYNKLSGQIDPRLYVVYSEGPYVEKLGAPFLAKYPYVDGSSPVKFLAEPVAPPAPGSLMGDWAKLKKVKDDFFSDMSLNFLKDAARDL